jgi:hypothetical protein
LVKTAFECGFAGWPGPLRVPAFRIPKPFLIEFITASRLRALISELGVEERTLVDFLMEELERFTGDGWEQEDDITLLTLKRSVSLS